MGGPGRGGAAAGELRVISGLEVGLTIAAAADPSNETSGAGILAEEEEEEEEGLHLPS